MPPTLRIGRTATAITMIPIPPSHCRIARQSNMPRGALSRSDMTVEPVVVKPDIASKKASVMLSCGDENQSGKLANRVMVSQLTVVKMKVSLRLS